jgi:hypothetical protein
MVPHKPPYPLLPLNYRHKGSSIDHIILATLKRISVIMMGWAIRCIQIIQLRINNSSLATSILDFLQ